MYHVTCSRTAQSVGHICVKVAELRQNCEVAHNSQGLVEFATLQIPEGRFFLLFLRCLSL